MTGLTSKEAAKRLQDFGPNKIVSSPFKSFISEARKVLLDPMGLMLLVLAILYLTIGYKTDALILLCAYIPVTGVDVLLQIRAHKALKALSANILSVVKVIRDEQIQEVPTTNIVVGDVIVFEEGRSLPADGTIIEADNLKINEAALTGESIPVDKTLGSLFLGGTLPLQGRGLGRVERTGKDTRFGQISSLIEETEAEISPLQQKINHLIHRFLWFAFFLAGLLFVIEIWRDTDWVQSLIVATTFGMAAVPEEFPLVFTLYLSLGAWRLSRHGVLVKSLPSVEALGSVDVICTDKTGTLTEGRFQLESITPIGDASNELLWKCALMACEVKIIDSMELAISEKGGPYQSLLNGWYLTFDYPFESQGKHMSHVWQNQSGTSVISMKGAIEGVLEHCSLTHEETARLSALTHALTQQGKRLLGLAYREGKCSGNRELDEKGLTFLGVLVFNDPTRASARLAVQECQKAGIQIKMLTGDHPGTAHAVADEIGMAHDHQLLFTGEQLAKMNRLERWQAFQQGAIFSRVLPEQKYEMVQALKENKKVVAMTGDGINDAPALKLADIGISMGENATDVARSTAQMILLKNDFKGIVEAVFEGRRIFQNLKKSFSYLIAFHVPIILLAFLPPLLGWGNLLLPIHIVLLELIVHPVSAFAFENLPVNSNGRETTLLSKRRLLESVICGIVLSLACLALYRSFGRSLALVTLLFGVMAFMLVESWPAKNQRVISISVVLIILTVCLASLPFLENLFHLTQLTFKDLGFAFLIGIVSCGPRLPALVKANQS